MLESVKNDDRKRELVEDFYHVLVTYLSTLNKIRVPGLELKEKLDTILGMRNDVSS